MQRSFISREWTECDLDKTRPTARQQMIRDVVTRALPGRKRAEIVNLLGPSRTHQEMKRYTLSDLETVTHASGGRPRFSGPSGEGYYFDQYDWDLLYPIGVENSLACDVSSSSCGEEYELLVIRLDREGIFSEWYIIGSPYWANIVGESGISTYQSARSLRR